MKNKIKLTLTLILISILEVKSQTFFRSDTNRIKISGGTITSRPRSSGPSIYFETQAFNFTGQSDTIAFDHWITNSSGSSERLRVQLIDTNGNVFQTLLNFQYNGSNSNSEKFVITSMGKYKVRFTPSRYSGNSSQRFIVSNMTMGTPLIMLAVKEPKPRKIKGENQDYKESNSNLKLYPIPFLEILKIENENISSVRIKDGNGNILKHEKYSDFKNYIEIDTKSFEPGIYFIEIEIEESKIISKLITKVI